ncbi:hypothetical protein HanRHA438_Chr12g0552851 [Helianthus annuus]|nr:hypothetical protein HanRHA438_Chr12g0552851 [Helianthus annuus]
MHIFELTSSGLGHACLVHVRAATCVEMGPEVQPRQVWAPQYICLPTFLSYIVSINQVVLRTICANGPDTNLDDLIQWGQGISEMYRFHKLCGLC